jgi:hypothetical protein
MGVQWDRTSALIYLKNANDDRGKNCTTFFIEFGVPVKPVTAWLQCVLRKPILKMM